MAIFSRCVTTFSISVFCLFNTVAAHATLITSSAGIPGLATIINFSDKPFQFSAGPLQVGALAGRDVLFSGNSNSNSGFSAGTYVLGDNGFWGAGGFRYAFINTGVAGGIRFTFNDGLQSGVGGFVNYAVCRGVAGCGSGDLLMRVLDVGLNILETHDVSLSAPISTFNADNGGAFRGIVRSNADIFAFELLGAAGVIDDLTFSNQVSAVVPEPAVVLLTGLGLIGLARINRR